MAEIRDAASVRAVRTARMVAPPSDLGPRRLRNAPTSRYLERAGVLARHHDQLELSADGPPFEYAPFGPPTVETRRTRR